MEKKKKTQIINNNENDRKTSPEKRLSIKKLKKENNENKLSTPLLSNNQKQLRYSFKPKTTQLKLLLNDKKENKDSRQVFSNTLKSHNRKSIDENNSNSNTFDNNHKRTGSEQLKFKKEEIKLQNREKKIKNYNILNIKSEKKAKTTQKTSPRKKFFSNNLIYNNNSNNSNINNNILDNNNISNNSINKNLKSKDFSMNDTLNIIAELQKQFSNIINDNNKPLNKIQKKIDIDYLNIYNYVPLSENEKKNILNDIERTSELRIQNYETAFNFINNSLNSIQNYFKNYMINEENQDLNEARLFFDKDKDNETDKEDFDKLKISSSSSSDIIFQNDDNYTNNIITSKRERKKLNFEETDFEEDEIYENAKIIPPKNYNNENIRNRSKKFSIKQLNNNLPNFYTKHRTVIIKKEDEIKELMNKLTNQSNYKSDYFRTKTIVTPKKIFTEENEDKENTINVERSSSKKDCFIF